MNRTKPEIDFPTEPVPDELVIIDEIAGDETDTVQPGDVVAVHYVGVSHSTGEEFDSSWDRGEPLQFPVGVGMVIEGWDKGLLGMGVGGRRKLIIPPHQAYGDRGAPPVIAPGETLIFVCDLVSRRAAQ